MSENNLANIYTSNDVFVSVIDGVSITKTADKAVWVSGPLTYTLLVTNTTEGELTDIVVTDQIEETAVNFNTEYGVLINGVSATNYSYQNGLLSVPLTRLGANESASITFQVVIKNE